MIFFRVITFFSVLTASMGTGKCLTAKLLYDETASKPHKTSDRMQEVTSLEPALWSAALARARKPCSMSACEMAYTELKTYITDDKAKISKFNEAKEAITGCTDTVPRVSSSRRSGPIITEV